MKPQTKIAKARAKYIREVWQIAQEDSLSKLARKVGFSRQLIAEVLCKHDPELYIRVNGHLHDYLLLDIKTSLLKQLDLSREGVKFKMFIQLLIDGENDKQELALKCNVSVRQIYRFINKLRVKIEEIRED